MVYPHEEQQEVSMKQMVKDGTTLNCDDKSENFYIGKRSFPELNKATAEKASLLAVGDFLDLGNGMALQRYA